MLHVYYTFSAQYSLFLFACNYGTYCMHEKNRSWREGNKIQTAYVFILYIKMPLHSTLHT
jgi:hypothetical protein